MAYRIGSSFDYDSPLVFGSQLAERDGIYTDFLLKDLPPSTMGAYDRNNVLRAISFLPEHQKKEICTIAKSLFNEKINKVVDRIGVLLAILEIPENERDFRIERLKTLSQNPSIEDIIRILNEKGG